MRETHFDVAVIGGGPAGSATALRLRQLGVQRVLLAEASRFDTYRIGESMPPDSRALLARLGVLRAFQAEDHAPCLGSCSSWGSGALGFNDFMVNPYGHGWHVDRRRFDAWLARQAEDQGARLETGWRFASACTNGDGYRLTFQTAPEIRRQVDASVVVDATGVRARFARQMGARRHTDDRLICLAAVFSGVGAERMDQLTLLEAAHYGWWYAARLSRDRAVVAVTTDVALCKQRMLRDPRSWLWHLARMRHLGPRLDGGRFDAASLEPYAALSSQLSAAGGRDWLAVGDAAWTSDPLAAQGIHRALASGLEAGDAIARRLRGELGALEDHAERWAVGYESFLRLRRHLYAREQRWPNSPFWRARHGRRLTGSSRFRGARSAAPRRSLVASPGP